jgi:hypothetical protein
VPGEELEPTQDQNLVEVDMPSDVEEGSRAGTETESSSDDSTTETVNTNPAPKRMFSIGMRSMSSFGEQAPGVCMLCEKAFEEGEDVCQSHSPRCNHLFHKDW